ncbi:toll/interleukin-1 receptor domain-containing protein [Paenibacillus sp. FSL L8-0470]|uniref:toll/interleukin-1 receptor domain-containing protein n=1 Tax=Paenibacillus sp. FSL L8-0470 TaxID=2954688 RepID=UPI0030FCD4F5
MRIFLSWSGNESRQLAAIFKEWLPNVLQYAEPYMSSKDISLGEMWNNNIRNNLEESVFGLIFVTPANINAPWINYEAGALSKTLDSKVVPILYHTDVMILNEGPLKQFQSARSLEKEDIFNLLKSINNSKSEGKLDVSRLEKAFDVWWPDLDGQISNITEIARESSEESEPTEKELLNVIVSKILEQEKWIKKEANNNQINNNLSTPTAIINDLLSIHTVLGDCYKNLDGGPFSESFMDSVTSSINSLEDIITYLDKSGSKKTNKRLLSSLNS